jgi:hypothetical protein
MKIMLAGCLMLACAAAVAAETVYKYRGADGKTLYSNRPIPGAELIETFEYTAPASSPRSDTSKSDAAGEERIRKQLSGLDAAWVEVQESGKALAAAEARLAAGATPEEGEVRSVAGSATPAPPSAGGPMAPAPPSAGGPMAPAPSSAGGPMDTQRGGGVRPEYVARLAELEADVAKARFRNQEAWSRFNALR